MSRSEIDDIFAAPPKKKAKTSLPERRNVPVKSCQPKTILNPSRKHKRRREKKSTMAGDDARFKDSRGSAPRHKTADGYNIYKEDELGLSSTGGDTPLCPFDCHCCF